MLKKQNGITLIALIITIIVMLILVGVTINVALNGGLFDKAKEAATEMEKQSIYEQIVMGMKLDNGKINVEETFNEAKDTLSGLSVTEKSSGINYKVITVEGKNGTYTYTITEDKIEMGEKIPQAPSQDPPEIGQVNNQNGEALQVGDFIKYNGETWIVYKNDEISGLQILSTEAKGNVTLSGIDGLEIYKSEIFKECENYVNTSQGGIDAITLGGFDFANKDYNEYATYYLEKISGEKEEIKIINYNDQSLNFANLITILTIMGQNSLQLTDTIWMCQESIYAGLGENNLIIDGGELDNPTLGIRVYNFSIGEADHEELVGYDMNTKEITEKTATHKVIPVVQIDKRIVINNDGNDGSTPEKAYTYTFNQ